MISIVFVLMIVLGACLTGIIIGKVVAHSMSVMESRDACEFMKIANQKEKYTVLYSTYLVMTVTNEFNYSDVLEATLAYYQKIRQMRFTSDAVGEIVGDLKQNENKKGKKANEK